MTDMQDDKHGRKDIPETGTPQSGRRPWSRPALTEYGHLAKLTRGASGAYPDANMNMVSMCL
jgi:hypothetical protein